ncbi:glycosyltransferase family 2 protein [Francisella sp. XLW-1]|uniref:glycosyltransferase family 2 protein n=1 Tax=Francisella sp. XLW-1 TaxID=2610887 RepID=UPI00123D4A6B|nr:glycosyltransferase [Francisella sp. XLW-1]
MFYKEESEIIKKWEKKGINPLISILCVTYNHEKYIAQALDSFLMQETDFVFEVIIRDDASIDGTADIIRGYEKNYPNIIKPIYESENQYSKGIKASQVIMKKAKSKYIALCDGDDYWTDPHKLQKQVDFLEANPEYVICYTGVRTIDADGIPVDDYVGGATNDLTSHEMQRGSPINTLTTVFRNVIEEFPPEFNFTMIGDMFIWSLLSHYGKGKFMKDVKSCVHRQHRYGIHSLIGDKQRSLMALTLFTSLLKYYSRIGCSEELKNYYLSHIDHCINAVTNERKSTLQRISIQIQEQDTQIQEQDTQIQEQDTQIQEQDIQIQEQSIQIHEQNIQIHKLDNQVAYLTKEVDDYKAEINRIYSSKGSKLMKPFRFLMRIARSVVRKIRTNK